MVTLQVQALLGAIVSTNMIHTDDRWLNTSFSSLAVQHAGVPRNGAFQSLKV
jgi:hypothetical protein